MASMTPIMMAQVGAQALSMADRLTSDNGANAAAQQAYQRRVAELDLQQATAERARKENLKRLSAAQRASFAARGLTPGEGSSAALLEGMTSLSEAEAADRARFADLARQRIGADYAQGAGENLLSKKSKIILGNLDRLMALD